MAAAPIRADRTPMAMTDPIAWQEFEPALLQRAKAADRPVLMVLTVPWCHHCRDLLQTTFADAQVQATIRDAFVPVLVDAERRPDVNERFGTGGWPTIAYLTADGDLIANDNYLSPAQLQQQLACRPEPLGHSPLTARQRPGTRLSDRHVFVLPAPI